MPRTKSRKHQIQSVKVRCQNPNCNKACKGRIKRNGMVAAPGLSNHLSSSPACLNYYTKNVTRLKDQFDYRCSVVSQKNNALHQLRKEQTSLSFSPNDFALTGTSNGPCSPTFFDTDKPSQDNKISHSTLNTQTLYRNNRPNVCRTNIEATLSLYSSKAGNSTSKIHNNIDSSTDDNPSDSSTADGSSTFCSNHSAPTVSVEAVIDLLSDVDCDNVFAMMSKDKNQSPPSDNESDDSSSDEEKTPPAPLISHSLRTELELMKIVTKIKAPLCSCKDLFEWAIRSQSRPGFDFASFNCARSRKAILNELEEKTRYLMSPYSYEPITIKWLPDNSAVDVFVRPFKSALRSLFSKPELMQESKLSFPNSKNPYSCVNDPPVRVISELHHGSWWAESWQQEKCNPRKKEILVPVILYMDGISIDSKGRLSLTPLNMTLGIFSTATRQSNSAWETIYFHPDANHMSSNQSQHTRSIHNMENLHRGLDAALSSFKAQCRSGPVRTVLPWNGDFHVVNMKFSIAFVVGDTELHDKLCCRFGGRTQNMNYICRHCKCPTEQLVNGQCRAISDLWTPSDFIKPIGESTDQFAKKLSHHPVRNAFHDVNFGANRHNIHFATPGESLHMHQLGVAKRSIESFRSQLLTQPKGDNRKAHRSNGFAIISSMARDYGQSLSHQSDRHFPRVRFSSTILVPTKKEGNEYPGIIICLVLALLCSEGRRAVCVNNLIDNKKMLQFIKTFELILFFGEFLKKCGMKVRELDHLPSVVKFFINEIKTTFPRGKMGNKLIKNHLFFHLHKYISMFGPPIGWDSSACESHHKTDIKAPSKNTQKNASSFIEQTCNRKMELSLVECGLRSAEPNNSNHMTHKRAPVFSGGSKYDIFYHRTDNVPTMMWTAKSNALKPHLPPDVLKFCCQTFIGQTPQSDKVLPCCTEYNIVGPNGQAHKFRAHPSYRTDTGLSSGVWYDWAMFLYYKDEATNQEDAAPAQILCFVELTELQAMSVDHDSAGWYAVVRSFKKPPSPMQPSKIVSRGVLEDHYYVYPCSAINRPVAVVQEQTVPKTHNRFFVVGNRDLWLTRFHELLREKGGDYGSSSDDDGEFCDDLMPVFGSLNQLVRETGRCYGGNDGTHSEYQHSDDESQVDQDLSSFSD